jgi:nitronate monooxygenase
MAALALGAEGVTIGTRLLVSTECPIHENLKRALISATEVDTMPILGSLHNTLRAWKNPAAMKVAELEASNADLSEILSIVAGTATKRMYEDGEIDSGVIPCSESIGIVNEVKPVAEIINEMVKQAGRIRDRLGA